MINRLVLGTGIVLDVLGSVGVHQVNADPESDAEELVAPLGIILAGTILTIAGLAGVLSD